MVLTDVFLARLRARGKDFSVTLDRDDRRLEDESMGGAFMIFLVSLRQLIILFLSSGNLSQDWSYLLLLSFSNWCALSVRRVIASQFHGLALDRGWFHAMRILSLVGPPIWSSSYF
jgi:hypothetical protein